MAKLKRISFENFKSYQGAALELSPLTLLVGANASGKSNAIEGLQLCSWLARGRRLDDLHNEIQKEEISIRGRLLDLGRDGSQSIEFSCLLEDSETNWNCLAIELLIQNNSMRIGHETLRDGESGVYLYETVQRTGDRTTHDVSIRYKSFQKGTPPQITANDLQAIFTQLLTPARFGLAKSRAAIPAACEQFMEALQNVVFLDPIPSAMREFSFPGESKLTGNGSNLSGVLSNLIRDHGKKDEILSFVRDLPEQEITDITFGDNFRGDVLLRLHETFGKESIRDAALLSDGTLRVLAVAAAVLSAQEGSVVVIEEIDNGIHPSRAALLLSKVLEVAERKNLSVLLTTHNPALLDALPKRSIPDVVFCYRDIEDGDSKLVKLSELPNYTELVARGPLGRLMTQGLLDWMVKHAPSPEERAITTAEYIRKLEAELVG